MAGTIDDSVRPEPASCHTTPGTENGQFQQQQTPSRPEAQDSLGPVSAAGVQLDAISLDARPQVVLHFDFMSESATRAATAATLLASLLGVAILIAEMVIKFKKEKSTERFRRQVSNCNIAASGLCLLLLLCNLAMFIWRVAKAWHSNQRWSLRQQRSAGLIFIENVVQCVNLTFYTMPNVYLNQRPCNITDPFLFWCAWVRWTCWNTLFMLFLVHAYGSRVWRPPAAPLRTWQCSTKQNPTDLDHLWYLDGPWRLFWPILIPWCCVEAVLTFSWTYAPKTEDIMGVGSLCGDYNFESGCTPPAKMANGINVMVALVLLYFVITCGILLKKLRALNSLPYDRYQGAIVFYRLQLRLRTVLMIFYTLCLVLLWYVAADNCTSPQFTWMGIMPMQVVTSVHIFVMTLLAMPHNPSDHAIATKMWQQQFAWTESGKEAKLVARASALASTDKLAQQPLFCVESMMHLLYFSCLVYDYKRAATSFKAAERALQASVCQPAVQSDPSTPASGSCTDHLERSTLTLPTAMSLYQLTESKVFTELQTDTRCLLAWNATRIVITFRGTASVKNAKADLQAWQVAHPPARGRRWAGSSPRVHAGFLRCWQAGGLNTKVLDHVRQLVQQFQCTEAQQDLQIYVTGHSLGGALAMLAVLDIARELRQANVLRVQLACYTFGAPRAGNGAFAAEYDELVQDSWSVINDQDLVTRGGKFIFMYKRCGRRVIINAGGHMMVAPSRIEAWVQEHTIARSWQHHLLASYYHATLAVILAQFSHKGFTDGMAGVIELAEASSYLQNLLDVQMGMQLAEMRQHARISLLQGHKSLPGAHMPAVGFYLRKHSQLATIV